MILFGSNADTELLALRSAWEDLPAELGDVHWFHADRVAGSPSIDGVSIVVVRLLGGAAQWEAGFAALRTSCRAAGVPFVALGGEAQPDAALLAASTVPSGVARQAHAYLAAGGPENMANLLRFLSDTLLLTGHGFGPPVTIPAVSIWDGAGLGAPGGRRRHDRALVAIVFYRAHLVAGNTSSIRDLAAALDVAGADVLCISTSSLRADRHGRVEALELCRDHGVDVIITSTLAAGAADGDGDGWSVPGLDGLGIPVIQSPSTGASRAAWLADDIGLGPLDVASGVAVPEFDGRIIGPTFAFKEVVDDAAGPGGEIVAARADPERTARLARLAVNTARLRGTPNQDKRVAVVLSAYPTKRSRLGNAVGLDTPASAIRLLHALRDEGYRIDRIPVDGDALMDELAIGFAYDQTVLTPAQVAVAAGTWSTDGYGAWFDGLPGDARSAVESVWGAAPGEVYVSDGRLVFTGIDLGGVLVTIQPPRGFGADPIGTYHAPDLPPPHHYLAAYRWMTMPTSVGGWGADAVVHLGKHGTMEWLPGKALALSGSCFPDVAIADVPLFYPFVVNDPGEGTQAKRRAHAVIIDHLPPPLTRADTYDELAQLEQLLDGHAQSAAMDPAKLPAIRAQVWEVLVGAEIHRDLDLGDAPPDDDSFDEMILHVDGYLCALKDAQIRGGLHVLGTAPADTALVDTVLAITRQPQGEVPALRSTVAAAKGIDVATAGTHALDDVEAECRRLVEGLAAADWSVDAAGDEPTLRWVASTLVP
ncbi:MAG: cobaltochelatase subunit CobN, partial [Ilumatobacteraceae bacterium]